MGVKNDAMDHNIRIKNADVLHSLMSCRYDPLLIEILIWVAKTYGLCITEGWRPKRHENDLHGTIPVRACDLRFWFYPPDEAVRIEREINERWTYDPTRPHKQVARIHDVGNGKHFHIQVHPKTVINQKQKGR